MRKTMLGIVIGLMLGGAAHAVAEGFLIGWTVKITTSEGIVVKCDDPFLWASLKEIECDGGEVQ